jgi:hypothetical protein
MNESGTTMTERLACPDRSPAVTFTCEVVAQLKMSETAQELAPATPVQPQSLNFIEQPKVR